MEFLIKNVLIAILRISQFIEHCAGNCVPTKDIYEQYKAYKRICVSQKLIYCTLPSFGRLIARQFPDCVKTRLRTPNALQSNVLFRTEIQQSLRNAHSR